MPHFFVTTNCQNPVRITVSDKENYRHIAKVLRAKIGETLLLVDENQTQHRVVIESIDSNTITTKVIESFKANHSLGLELYLAQSVLKTDAQNLVVQKATELGAKGIIPFISDNSVIKATVVDLKVEKWQKIANEAVKQCERTDFPIVSERMTLDSLLKSKDYPVKIACVEREKEFSLKACLRGLNLNKGDKVLVVIGPEGGFSASELRLLEQSDVHRVTLGKMILRAETAVVTALSNVIYELEND